MQRDQNEMFEKSMDHIIDRRDKRERAKIRRQETMIEILDRIKHIQQESSKNDSKLFMIQVATLVSAVIGTLVGIVALIVAMSG